LQRQALDSYEKIEEKRELLQLMRDVLEVLF